MLLSALIRSSSMLFTVPIAGITREGQIALRVQTNKQTNSAFTSSHCQWAIFGENCVFRLLNAIDQLMGIKKYWST